MRILAVLAWLATCIAQTKLDTRSFNTLGSGRFEILADGIMISVGGREFRVGESQLPLNASDCTAPRATRKCVQYWDGIAWDEPRGVFYLAAATDTGQNKPWIIFEYDLRSLEIRRIGDEEGGGFSNGAVSPSGRYLAYIGYDVCGVCCTTSRLVVLDTQTREAGTFNLPPANRSEILRIVGIRWTGVSTIQYEAQTLNETACRDGKGAQGSLTGSVKLAQILKGR